MQGPSKFPEIFEALAEPWPDDEVGRLSKGNHEFGYIRADQVMQRLDDVLGPENWWDAYQRDPCGSDSVLCLLTIVLPDGRELTKCDLGAPADMPDEGDSEKSAVSDALKRAGVKFGIGRWLRDKSGRGRPRRESRAEAAGDRRPSQARPPHPPEPEPMRRPGTGRGKPPTTGGALYRWAKDRDERDDAGLVDHLGQWARREGLPPKMVQWDADDVSRGYAEAVKRLQSAEALAN